MFMINGKYNLAELPPPIFLSYKPLFGEEKQQKTDLFLNTSNYNFYFMKPS